MNDNILLFFLFFFLLLYCCPVLSSHGSLAASPCSPTKFSGAFACPATAPTASTLPLQSYIYPIRRHASPSLCCACSMDSRNRRRNPPLVLYAPLISTRRSSASQTTDILPHSPSGLRLSVPFSWESSPGVPRPHISEDDEETPPPKSPPGRRENGKSMQVVDHETCASDSGEEEKDVFSDALEEISMSSDNFDIACSPSSFSTCDEPPPSFIMSRFLPAADALAKSSVHHSDRPDSSPSYQLRKEATRARFKQQGADTPSELPSMACGLMLFFPWSFKPTVFGFKSPVRPASTPRLGDPCSTPKKLCTSYNVWSSSEDNGGSGRYVEKLSVMLRHPHRCRMPFLDAHRSRSQASKARRTRVAAAKMQFLRPRRVEEATHECCLGSLRS